MNKIVLTALLMGCYPSQDLVGKCAYNWLTGDIGVIVNVTNKFLYVKNITISRHWLERFSSSFVDVAECPQ